MAQKVMVRGFRWVGLEKG